MSNWRERKGDGKRKRKERGRGKERKDRGGKYGEGWRVGEEREWEG